MRTLFFSTLLLTACATDGSDFELDQEAVDTGADDGKADGVPGLVRLERATPTQAAAAIQQERGAELTTCFAGYKTHFNANATYLTKNVADKFIHVSLETDGAACGDWHALGQIVKGVLDARGVSQATPATVIDGIGPWAKPQLQAASTAGYVDLEKAPLVFYSDLRRLQDEHAMDRERDPAGVDLAAIRAQWKEVRDDTTLDTAYLNPVTFGAGALEGSQIFRSLRAAFPLKYQALVSSGYAAIDDFAGAYEGPNDDPAFAPIRTALRKASIKKRFFFAGGGEGWSRNTLIVVDQHGQAWGMQMGYSE